MKDDKRPRVQVTTTVTVKPKVGSFAVICSFV